MNTITHYAIRDLHAIDPDDELPGTYDVLAKTEDGRIFYSEDIYVLDEAKDFVELMKTKPYEFEYWEDNPVTLARVAANLEWVQA